MKTIDIIALALYLVVLAFGALLCFETGDHLKKFSVARKMYYLAILLIPVLCSVVQLVISIFIPLWIYTMFFMEPKGITKYEVILFGANFLCTIIGFGSVSIEKGKKILKTFEKSFIN